MSSVDDFHLEQLLGYYREQRVLPSYAGIAALAGYASKNAAAKLVQRLIERGELQATDQGRLAPTARFLDRLDATTGARLPLLGRIAAGAPLLAEAHIEDMFAIEPRCFRPRADFLMRVSGTSMNALGIHDGDLVGIHKQPVADNGQIVAACILDPATGEFGITLKRYRSRTLRGGERITLEPQSLDPVHTPIAIQPQHDVFELVGIYAGHLHTGNGGDL